MAHRIEPSETSKMPKGIPYIIGNEAAERFSFYGMKTILFVFIAQYLHLMGDFPTDRISESQAAEWVYLFNMAVYLTPVLGAVIADLWWGKYKTIMRLSVVYCLGHLSLALIGVTGPASWWLLAGLVLISLGGGGIKPCVSAHVGDQFGTNNQHLISKIFNWFYFSINLGSVVSTLMIPKLLELYGPHIAFGVPGLLMGVATLLFWFGRHSFVHIPPTGSFVREVCSLKGIKIILKISCIFTFTSIFWSLFDQTATTWVDQSQDMDRNLFGFELTPSQIQFVNPFLILILIPIFTYCIYPLAGKFIKVTPLKKMGVGLFITAASFGVSALIQGWIEAGETPHVSWQIIAYILLTTAEVMVSIVCLEFAYTQAPKSMKSAIMSLFLLAVFAGNLLTWAISKTISVPSPHSHEIALFQKKKQLDPNSSYLEIDGFNKQSNIVVMFNPSGTVSSREIPSKFSLKEAALKITNWTNLNQRLPLAKEGNLIIGGSLDQWNKPITYKLINGSQARLRSNGADKESFTKWDSILYLNYTKPTPKENIEEKEPSWLEKRKKELSIIDSQDNSIPPAENFQFEYQVGGLKKIEGSLYFWFFTGLMLLAAFIFIPVAKFYTKSYLKSASSDDPTS